MNFSHALLDLLKAGEVSIDLIKCPLDMQIIELAQKNSRVYVHFPIIVGVDIKNDDGSPVRWNEVTRALGLTGQKFVNVHLAMENVSLFANKKPPMRRAQIMDMVLGNLEVITARFGSRNVLIENLYDLGNRFVGLSYDPSFIAEVLNRSNCRLLLDLAHARIASLKSGYPLRQYINMLPVSKVREVHITGVRSARRLRKDLVKACTTYSQIKSSRFLEHVAMTRQDFRTLSWLLKRKNEVVLDNNSIVALEYGGIGSFWEESLNKAVLKYECSEINRLLKSLDQETLEVV